MKLQIDTEKRIITIDGLCDFDELHQFVASLGGKWGIQPKPIEYVDLVPQQPTPWYPTYPLSPTYTPNDGIISGGCSCNGGTALCQFCQMFQNSTIRIVSDGITSEVYQSTPTAQA